jgi:hypothetical protein
VRTAPASAERYNRAQDSLHKELALPHSPPATHGISRKDAATIAALAQETDTDEAVVKDLYDEELETLHAQANVKNFIRVIAARRVRQRIAAAREDGRSLKTRAA